MQRVSLRAGSVLLIAGMLATIAGCGKDAALPKTAGPTNAIVVTSQLLYGKIDRRPSSVLGLFIADFLSHAITIPYRSAILGINAQTRLLISPDQQQGENFSLLQELGSALQADVNDVLNRSTDRRSTLDEYLTALQDVMQRSTQKVEQLDEQRDDIAEEGRDARDILRDLTSQQRDALREEDYSLAGAKQQEISVQQSIVDMIDTRKEAIDDTIDLFDDLLDIARERWTAITENREIILAGLKVIDVPGIEDLGVLRKESRQERRDRTDSEDGLFGPAR